MSLRGKKGDVKVEERGRFGESLVDKSKRTRMDRWEGEKQGTSGQMFV